MINSNSACDGFDGSKPLNPQARVLLRAKTRTLETARGAARMELNCPDHLLVRSMDPPL
jgi:hypothetical protein